MSDRIFFLIVGIVVVVLVVVAFALVGLTPDNSSGEVTSTVVSAPAPSPTSIPPIDLGDDTANEIVDEVLDTFSTAECWRQWNDGEIGVVELQQCLSKVKGD